MDLRPLYMFNSFSAGINFRRQNQILTSDVGLRTEKVKAMCRNIEKQKKLKFI